MDFNDILQVVFRWLHIGAGIMWIGLLYFFNFVNGPFTGTMDADTKKKVIPELAPRALYWFRWGAAYTWIFGILLVAMVYYMGGLMFDASNTTGWGGGAIFMVLFVFIIGPLLYDVLAKSPLGKNPKVFAAVGFILIVAVISMFINVGGFSYRAYVIHTGAMFGTMMAMNVWMRIWPSQKKIINGVKNGPPADAAVVALSGTRSKHNTYLSVPLVYTMINAHTSAFANSWLYLPLFVLVGWGIVWWTYKKAATIKGF